MSENPWNAPEAVACFQSEHEHAMKKAKEALAKAFAEGGPLGEMCNLSYATWGALNDDLGPENYRVFLDLIMAAPMVRKFLRAGETGKL